MRQRQKLTGKKKIVWLLLVVCMTVWFAGCGGGNGSASESSKISENVSTVLAQTTDYLYETVETPVYASVGGDWTMLVLAQSGYEMEDSYRASYLQNVAQVVKEKKGILNSRKITDYDRVILSLTALGEDVSDIAGYDLLKPLSNFTQVCQQGINGPIWTLIALDSKDYQIPENKKQSAQTTRKKLIAYILERQLPDGGWTLAGDEADADLTAMALQALSRYVSKDTKVKDAVEKAVNLLATMQQEDGAFSSGGTENVESTAQVMLALLSLNIDPQKDSRFIQQETTLYDALLSFRKEDGGFCHIKGEETNQMATEQAGCALTAYARYLDGKTFLYVIGNSVEVPAT